MIVTAIYDYLIYYRLWLAADTAVAHFRTILLRIFFNQIRTNVRKCDGLHTPDSSARGHDVSVLGDLADVVPQSGISIIHNDRYRT